VEQRSVKDLVFGDADEEIRVLRHELWTAIQGEERSRKAIDDLSVMLSDITMEAKQVKLWLSEEHDRCRLEAEESAVAWGDKERVLLDHVRASEEVNRARQENTKLMESQRVIRGENPWLWDILKQAVAEANTVKRTSPIGLDAAASLVQLDLQLGGGLLLYLVERSSDLDAGRLHDSGGLLLQLLDLSRRP
jgi:hypothetical protein